MSQYVGKTELKEDVYRVFDGWNNRFVYYKVVDGQRVEVERLYGKSGYYFVEKKEKSLDIAKNSH